MGQIFQVQQILGSHQGSSRSGSSTCFFSLKQEETDRLRDDQQIRGDFKWADSCHLFVSGVSWTFCGGFLKRGYPQIFQVMDEHFALKQPWGLRDSTNAQVAVGGWHWAVTVWGPSPHSLRKTHAGKSPCIFPLVFWWRYEQRIGFCRHSVS